MIAKSRRLPPMHPGEVLREDLITALGLSINGLVRDLRDLDLATRASARWEAGGDSSAACPEDLAAVATAVLALVSAAATAHALFPPDAPSKSLSTAVAASLRNSG